MNIALRVLGIGLLLCAAPLAARAQRADSAQSHVERAVDAISRVQDRVNRVQDRGAAAQDRAARAVEAVARAGAAAAAADLDLAERVTPRAQAALATKLVDQYRMLARANPQVLEILDRFAAVRGEIVAVDPSAEVLAAATRGGFDVAKVETIDGLDLRYVTLHSPAGETLAQSLAKLRKLAPGGEFTANYIHLQSGGAEGTAGSARLAPSTPVTGPALGMIDGGVASTASVDRILQQGFASGAPRPDAHATAVASLLAGSGGVKSAAPGAPLLAADIYGADPKGGNALALAKALGWLVKQRATVVVVSLVGPANPLVARAVKAAQARGIVLVAPVGNDGAAAPPMFPAAYPAVIGVTAVDRRNRALVEAGRGAQVDFAAPGADILAAGLGEGSVRVRGTSYAAPLVAGRLWLARASDNPLAALAARAVDLGPRGRDVVFGDGLICAECR
jgi:hypothetical protein